MEKETIAATDKKVGEFSLLGLRLDRIQLSRHILVDVVAMLDMSLVIIIAFLLEYFYVQTYNNVIGLGQGWVNYFSVTALVAVVLYAALRWRNHYSYDDFEDWTAWHGGFRLAITVIFAFAFSLSIVFLLKQIDHFSRLWVAGWMALSFLTLFASKVFWVAQFRRFAAKGLFRRRVFLIGAGSALSSVRANLAFDPLKVDLVGESDLEGVAESVDRSALNVILNGILSKSMADSLDEVVIALPGNDSALLDPIIRRLKMLPIDIKVALDLGPNRFKALGLSHIGSTNAISVQKRPISDWDVFIKASEDYALTVLALLFFLPAMAVIAILIKLDSKGPVFFSQRRNGLNHKVIKVLKFRTMAIPEDRSEIKHSANAGYGFTRVGRVLRKTSLDELPQLFNVLAGDLSLVGPRPHALSHNTYFSEMLEEYASRHRVKPGVTGWAQVNGFRGEITSPELMAERMRYDLEYIDNWSIWFDLSILFMTLNLIKNDTSGLRGDCSRDIPPGGFRD